VRETEWLDAMIDRVLSWRAAAKDRGLAELRFGSIRPVVDEAAARFLRMVRLTRFNCACDSRAHLRSAMTRARWSSAAEPAGQRLEVLGGPEADRPGGPEQGPWASSRSRTTDRIPAGEIRRIFEPFHRVKGAASGTSGAGLGLAIVHHVSRPTAARHRGLQGGRREPLFDLPARRAAGRGAVKRGEPASPQGRRETILVVEDDGRSAKVSK